MQIDILIFSDGKSIFGILSFIAMTSGTEEDLMQINLLFGARFVYKKSSSWSTNRMNDHWRLPIMK